MWDAGTSPTPSRRALAHRGHHLALVRARRARAVTLPIRLDIEGDVDVEVPDLARYETGAGS